MKIVIGSDHGGYPLKESLKAFLQSRDYDTADVGTHSETPVDYPEIAVRLCNEITSGNADLGVLVCGTGIGISIAANKVKGIRAALCGDPFSAKMARRHNNANVVCLGGRVLGPGLAEEILKAFLAADFEGGRHQRRIDKIMDIEKEQTPCQL